MTIQLTHTNNGQEVSWLGRATACARRVGWPGRLMARSQSRSLIERSVCPTTYVCAGEHYASVTQEVHFGQSYKVHPHDVSEFKSHCARANHELIRDPEALAEYRARWLNEGEPVLRVQRFTSANAAAVQGSVPSNFVPHPQRFLVGVPKSVEYLREKAVDALGLDAVLRLALSLPATFRRSDSSMVNPLRGALIKLGVKLSVDEANELWQHLDHGHTNEAHLEDVIAALLGHPLDGARLTAVKRAWENLEELAHGTGDVTMGLVGAAFDGASHPDARRKPVPRITAAQASARVYEGLAAVVAMRQGSSSSSSVSKKSNADVNPSTVVTFDVFEDYCSFLSAGTELDEEFCRFLDMGFRIGAPADSLAAATATLAASGKLNGSMNRSLSPRSQNTSSTRAPPSPRGPSVADIARSVGGPRTTYGEMGQGLAFASKPYQPLSRDSMPSPNRRQSRATHAGDPDAAAASALPNVVVLVTHNDGSKKLHKIPKDRFLQVNDEVALRERLAKIGVFDVREAKVDF